MTLPANLTAKFTTAPGVSAEADMLAELGLSAGDATHLAAAVMALLVIKAIF